LSLVFPYDSTNQHAILIFPLSIAIKVASELLPPSQGTRRKNCGAIIKEDMQQLSVSFFALACMRRIP
jgi:hypothetical protein